MIRKTGIILISAALIFTLAVSGCAGVGEPSAKTASSQQTAAAAKPENTQTSVPTAEPVQEKESKTEQNSTQAQVTEAVSASAQESILPHETAEPDEEAAEDETVQPEPEDPAGESITEETPEAETTAETEQTPEPAENLYEGPVELDPSWEFADFSVIHSGSAVLYRAKENRKNHVIGVNAGHGTAGGESQSTYSHPDMSPKVTGGTNAEGAVMSMAISAGMTFFDGTAERDVNERTAQILKDLLLASGYDVLMIRESEDVQLDNIARTIICNNMADCHIAIHFDGDGLDYDKGCFYMSVPDGLKGMYPVSDHWEEHERLGECLIAGLSEAGCTIMDGASLDMDLTQTSYSTVPSVDIELGNAASDHSDEALTVRAQGLLAGIDHFFDGQQS